MNQARLRFSVRGLMVLAALAAVGLAGYELRNREPPLTLWEREHRWCGKATTEPWPRAGEGWQGDVLAKVARANGVIHGHLRGQSWLVTPDGKVSDHWHIGLDAGGDEVDAPKEGLARLPALLGRLPASDPAVDPSNRLVVAFPVRGAWVVRTYRRDAVPREVEDLAEALKLAGWR